MGVILKTFGLIFWEAGSFGGWEKLVCGCQGEEPAFDFKLGNCFDISVEGAIYHKSDLQLQLRRLSFGYKVFKKDFWEYLGIFFYEYF